MQEFDDLSRQLNSASDTINPTITTLNTKLRSLNLGVEVWLTEALFNSQPGGPRREGVGPYLGYCNVEDQWQLAVREQSDAVYLSASTGECAASVPLTKASRRVRIAALEQLPVLVSRLKEEAQRVLKVIQDAKALYSESLTMDKNELLATVLKGLAEGFEAGNNRRRRTFTPTTPDEEQPLREVLAELRAEGSVNELGGTYQFTPDGYKKYKAHVDWLRAMQGL